MFLKRLLAIIFMTTLLFGSAVSTANAAGPSGMDCKTFVEVRDYFNCTFNNPSGVEVFAVSSDNDLYVHWVSGNTVRVEAISAGVSEVCAYTMDWRYKTCDTVNIYPIGGRP